MQGKQNDSEQKEIIEANTHSKIKYEKSSFFWNKFMKDAKLSQIISKNNHYYKIIINYIFK